MKVSQHFGTLFTLLVIGQVVLTNYSQLGPYVMLSMLPAMILCIPPGISTVVGMAELLLRRRLGALRARAEQSFWTRLKKTLFNL